MKKILKNKKGFTLVELLAVIVVLAIIMVIATTQINSVIKKSRGDSFVSSYKLVLDAVKKCELQSMTADECKGTVDLSDDYNLTLSKVEGGYNITLSAAENGKFHNMDLTQNYQKENGADDKKEKLTGATEVDKKSITASYTTSDATGSNDTTNSGNTESDTTEQP